MGTDVTQYVAYRSIYRWSPTVGSGPDTAGMHALRSTLAMRDIQATSPRANIHYVLSGQNIDGMTNGSPNYVVAFGSSNYNTDSLNTWGTTPIANHDAFATAPYVCPDDSYFAGQFATDSSNYALGGSSATTAIANFVNAVKTATFQGLDTFLSNQLSQIASYMAPLGKYMVNYEGGADWATSIGSNICEGGGTHTLTTADSNFVIGVLNSSAWGTVQTNFFNSFCALSNGAMPAVLSPIPAADPSNFSKREQRWCYCNPDSYASGVEGQQLLNSGAWTAISTRNQGITITIPHHGGRGLGRF